MNGTRDSMMNIRWSMHADLGMAVPANTPGEETGAEFVRVLQRLEPVRELQPILKRLYGCLRE